jgi:hypothetical protein
MPSSDRRIWENQSIPLGIFRTKGLVRLDLGTDDYGLLQVTGRRGWLKLVELESE